MLSWLPAALLIAVAVLQRWRMHTVQQSAWKGGGFGMFSDILRNAITAEIWVRDDDGRLQPLPVEGDERLSRAAAIPTARNILHCGQALLKRPTCRAAAVTLHHLRIDFDGIHGLYTATEQRAYRVTSDTAEVMTP